MVAAGIFLSRIAGLIRQRVFAHYFATSDAADAFAAGFRIPNLLQNLFGEGALSASFIPVYAGARSQKNDEEAEHIAGAVAGLLGLVVAIGVLLGVLGAPLLVRLIAPGFEGAKRDLTIVLVRILFPGAGLLVLSAWCLGVLNSHGKFFLSYAAPIIWNVALIAALVIFGPRRSEASLAVYAAWASVAGSALQIGVQLPAVLSLFARLRFSLSARSDSVRTVIRSFFPAFVSRGVIQISAFVDALLASLLPGGAVAALGYAQTLYTLPVSLFGMSVSAAELPAMSSVVGDEVAVAAYLRGRLDNGLRQIAFFVVPSAMAFAVLGQVIAAALFQSGRFSADDTRWVWGILAGSAVGLLASTLGRLYASTYYALRDTRTPLRFALLRVTLTIGLGYLCAIQLPPILGLPLRWGAAGLTISAGIAGWVEFYLLRRGMNARIGVTGIPRVLVLKLYSAAGIAAAAAWGVNRILPLTRPVLVAVIVLGVYGLVYFVLAHFLKVAQATALLNRVVRPRG
ncbi:MAG: murein biosynthesis integral membrane protein MurJ [Gemmatimonadota bacterium]